MTNTETFKSRSQSKPQPQPQPQTQSGGLRYSKQSAFTNTNVFPVWSTYLPTWELQSALCRIPGTEAANGLALHRRVCMHDAMHANPAAPIEIESTNGSPNSLIIATLDRLGMWDGVCNHRQTINIGALYIPARHITVLTTPSVRRTISTYAYGDGSCVFRYS